jgi:O-antigen ligase
MLKKTKEFIFPFFIAMLPIISVFFPVNLVGLYLVVLFLLFFTEKNKKNNFIQNKNLLIPYIIFVLFCILATFLSKDINSSLKNLERYSSLIVIPFIIFCSNLSEKRTTLILKVYVVSLILISLFSIGKLIWFVNVFEDWIKVMRDVNKNDVYVQFKYPHLMWDVHPSYWSYLIVLANIILLNNKYLGIIFSKKTTIILLLLFNINLFYLSARVPILINIIIHLISITFVLIKNLKYLALFYIGVFIVLIIAYLQLPFLRYKIEGIASDDRFFLWSIAYEGVKNNYFVFGEGFGLAKDFISNSLITVEDTRRFYKGNEIHNQYLTVLLENGLLGFLLLLFVFIKSNISISKTYKVSTSLPSISVLIIVVLASFIEPFFSVLKGIIIFSFFSSLFKLKFKQNDII